jgi:hypothetical protein
MVATGGGKIKICEILASIVLNVANQQSFAKRLMFTCMSKTEQPNEKNVGLEFFKVLIIL